MACVVMGVEEMAAGVTPNDVGVGDGGAAKGPLPAHEECRRATRRRSLRHGEEVAYNCTDKSSECKTEVLPETFIPLFHFC